MFNNLKTDDSVEQPTDNVGGGSRTLESGLYDFVIDLAYVDFSKGGAMSLNLHLTNSNNQSLRSQLWMTSGTAKGQKNYYEGKDGKKKYLPGFIIANDLCLLTIGQEISEIEPEEKTVKLYNFDLKKEAPTKVQVVTELLGQQVTVGVHKILVDKNVKDTNGNYVASGEYREINEVVKVFRADDKFTVLEIKAEADEATVFEKWADNNTGKVIDKRDKEALAAQGGNDKTSSKASTGGNKSLFNR